MSRRWWSTPSMAASRCAAMPTCASRRKARPTPRTCASRSMRADSPGAVPATRRRACRRSSPTPTSASPANPRPGPRSAMHASPATASARTCASTGAATASRSRSGRCARRCRPARSTPPATHAGRRSLAGTSTRRWPVSIPAISCRHGPVRSMDASPPAARHAAAAASTRRSTCRNCAADCVAARSTAAATSCCAATTSAAISRCRSATAGSRRAVGSAAHQRTRCWMSTHASRPCTSTTCGRTPPAACAAA